MEQLFENSSFRFVLLRLLLCAGFCAAALFLLGGTRGILMGRDAKVLQQTEIRDAAVLCASCAGDQKNAMLLLAEQSPELMLRASAQTELAPVGE